TRWAPWFSVKLALEASPRATTRPSTFHGFGPLGRQQQPPPRPRSSALSPLPAGKRLPSRRKSAGQSSRAEKQRRQLKVFSPKPSLAVAGERTGNGPVSLQVVAA